MDDVVTRREIDKRSNLLLGMRNGSVARPDDDTEPLSHNFNSPRPQEYLTDEEEKERRSKEMGRAIARLSAVCESRQTDLEWEGFPDLLTSLIRQQITNPAIHLLLQNQHIILRVRQIAESVSRTWLHGHVINTASPCQRSALASFLSPIYAHFENFLRTPGLQYLSHIQANGQYPVDMVWYKLHLFLTQNGFSIENVDAFKTHFETRWEDVFARADLGFLTDAAALARMVGADGHRPDLHQFSPHHRNAADQAVIRLAHADKVERNLAVAMSMQARLGEGVSPYLRRIYADPDMRNMVDPPGWLDTVEGRRKYGFIE
jgi:hypothetical protein